MGLYGGGEICALSFEDTAEEPLCRIIGIQLRGRTRMREGFFALAQSIEIVRRLKMRRCGFIIDRERGARVSKSQRELT